MCKKGIGAKSRILQIGHLGSCSGRNEIRDLTRRCAHPMHMHIWPHGTHACVARTSIHTVQFVVAVAVAVVLVLLVIPTAPAEASSSSTVGEPRFPLNPSFVLLIPLLRTFIFEIIVTIYFKNKPLNASLRSAGNNIILDYILLYVSEANNKI